MFASVMHHVDKVYRVPSHMGVGSNPAAYPILKMRL